MRSVPFGILCSVAAIVIATPALAASDYLLIIDGVDGEASVAVEVANWSWGQTNSSSGLRESPTRASTGRGVVTGVSPGVTPAVADLDGDGRPDLDALASVPEVSGFSITLASGGAGARSACAMGRHIAHAHLVARGFVYDLSDVVIAACDTGSGGTTMRLTGRIGDYRGGHVTLMK